MPDDVPPSSEFFIVDEDIIERGTVAEAFFDFYEYTEGEAFFRIVLYE